MGTIGRWNRHYVEYVLRPGYERWQNRYFDDFLDLQRAHLVALNRAGWVDDATAREIGAAIEWLSGSSLRADAYTGEVEDLFFAAERLLRGRLGDPADNLHIARSRNDIDATLYRMDLRRTLLELHERLGELSEALLGVAEEHLHTVMPGYTHGQQAQPTTLAHYLSAVLSGVERSRARLRMCYRETNRSPLGAAAFTTSGFYIDRELLADLLGFEGVVRNSYDAVAASDYALVFMGECAVVAALLSRFVADLFFWCSNEVAAFRVADAFVQRSSIMPNKRNPVVLEHIRSRLARALSIGQQGFALHTSVPYGDINDTADNLQPVWQGAVQLLSEATTLLAQVVETGEFDRELLLERAREGYGCVTELADVLVREHHLTFRQAHEVVSRVVDLAQRQETPPPEWTSSLIDTAALEVIGRTIQIDAASLTRALDPMHFVTVRKTMGGPNVDEMSATLADARTSMAHEADFAQSSRGSLVRRPGASASPHCDREPRGVDGGVRREHQAVASSASIWALPSCSWASLIYRAASSATRRVATHADDSVELPERISWLIDDLLLEAGFKPKDLIGIGIGAPGVVDKESDALSVAPGLTADGLIQLAGPLRARFQCPVYVENDVNAALLGEVWQGALRGAKNAALISVGTGIGVGLLINGEIHRGAHGAAGEIGYWLIGSLGPIARADGYGPLEAYAAGPGIAKRYIDRLRETPSFAGDSMRSAPRPLQRLRCSATHSREKSGGRLPKRSGSPVRTCAVCSILKSSRSVEESPESTNPSYSNRSAGSSTPWSHTRPRSSQLSWATGPASSAPS